MKAIKLNNGMILKEVNRYTDRNNNQMEVLLSSDVIYGEAYDPALVSFIKTVRLNIMKKREPILWGSLKDASRDEVLEKVFNDITAYKAAIQKQIDDKEANEVAVAEAQAVYEKAFAEWNAEKSKILKKIEMDPTYVLTEAESSYVETPPVITQVDEFKEILPLELAGENGFDYLQDLIVNGQSMPELVDFSEIIIVGE
ncbi:MAG: hypothetical protein B6241_12380 [Spirochaetaceae bacterium 4572_59]|nr:MAG: hypothetical protein B6241_12380 [Spirochaetaceae bacterium 4572_59]